MGYLDNSVEYGFGQLGSGHLQAGSSQLTPPSGLVIVAISFLDEIILSELTPVQINGVDTYFGTTATANTAGGSVVIDTSTKFPKGITIYGRWESVTMNAANDHGIIAYYGR
tara:strand:- start:874 stop:1209 length:336 start_codon:yes stop_codon:yes gene_type:complete